MVEHINDFGMHILYKYIVVLLSLVSVMCVIVKVYSLTFLNKESIFVQVFYTKPV